jgi:hypothetical protein
MKRALFGMLLALFLAVSVGHGHAQAIHVGMAKVAGCETGQNIDNQCTVTVTWTMYGGAFPNTNYVVNCSPEGIGWTGGGADIMSYAYWVPPATRTITGATIILQNMETGHNFVVTTFDCEALYIT